MLVPLRKFHALLCCPGNPGVAIELGWTGETAVSAAARRGDGTTVVFPIVAGQPVLIDFDRSIIARSWFQTVKIDHSVIGQRSNFRRSLKAALFGTAAASERNFKRFRALLARPPEGRPVVLMVGAGTRGMGTDALYDDANVEQIAFDIYPSAYTAFVADGHNIPIQDGAVDAVCVQAVLEHVLDPGLVVGEIYRVLKPGGIVYAETPFMQQVHEAAYDFTRFTELGHRWLWRRFEEIERGAIGGPGLSLYWSARYFFRGLTRSKPAGDILSLPFALFALLDRFIPKAHTMDGANGVFFLGRKTGGEINRRQLVAAYLGAQR